MATKVELRKITPSELDEYVLENHHEANFLQTSSWGKTYEDDGKQVFYFGVFCDNKLCGSAVAILKPAKRGRYLEIPGGPILDWDGNK